jgi:hypothetical protein
VTSVQQKVNPSVMDPITVILATPGIQLTKFASLVGQHAASVTYMELVNVTTKITAVPTMCLMERITPARRVQLVVQNAKLMVLASAMGQATAFLDMFTRHRHKLAWLVALIAHSVFRMAATSAMDKHTV